MPSSSKSHAGDNHSNTKDVMSLAEMLEEEQIFEFKEGREFVAFPGFRHHGVFIDDIEKNIASDTVDPVLSMNVDQ